MGQRAFNAEHLASIHAAMDGVLADTGGYRAPGASTFVDCRVFVDYETEVRGEFDQIIGHRIEVDFLLSDVSPAVRATLKVDDIDYVLTDKLFEKSGIARWVVRRV